MKFSKITVKIGSNVITRQDGTLDVTRMSALSDQIAALHRTGVEIILISSGAVASGRSTVEAKKKMDIVDERQLFSAVGQAKLMNHYWELFREHGIVVGQILTTKDNFSDRRRYLNQRNCIGVMLENGVLPIVNENDAVSVTELMFTDNDELSGLIASMMDSEALFILSNVDGIYSGNPTDENSKIIPVIKKGEDFSDFIQHSKSQFGRGGMLTKTAIARKIADEGIEVFIANGRRENILVQLLDENQTPVCTHFEAARGEVSSVKKWLSHSEDFAKGEVYIDENAENALLGEQAVSLLLVGVIKIAGDFEKDDIIRIFSEKGKLLGVGKVYYDSKQARKLIGVKNQKPLVHYDYLYLE